jgi:hypothetical protein
MDVDMKPTPPVSPEARRKRLEDLYRRRDAVEHVIRCLEEFAQIRAARLDRLAKRMHQTAA